MGLTPFLQASHDGTRCDLRWARRAPNIKRGTAEAHTATISSYFEKKYGEISLPQTNHGEDEQTAKEGRGGGLCVLGVRENKADGNVTRLEINLRKTKETGEVPGEGFGNRGGKDEESEESDRGPNPWGLVASGDKLGKRKRETVGTRS